MLANHTSIRHLLDRTLRQYDKLMERKVRSHPVLMFASSLCLTIQTISEQCGCASLCHPLDRTLRQYDKQHKVTMLLLTELVGFKP